MLLFINIPTEIDYKYTKQNYMKSLRVIEVTLYNSNLNRYY